MKLIFIGVKLNKIIISYKLDFYLDMWAHRDSNPEPTDYESAALTVELWALKTRET